MSAWNWNGASRLLALAMMVVGAVGVTYMVMLDRDSASESQPEMQARVTPSPGPEPTSTSVVRVERLAEDLVQVSDCRYGFTLEARRGWTGTYTASVAPSLDSAADFTANHKLRPYGAQPVITTAALPAGEARLVLPDPAAGIDKGEIIIAFPTPYLVPQWQSGAGTYLNLHIYALAADIERMARSLRFVERCAWSPPPTPAGAHGGF